MPTTNSVSGVFMSVDCRDENSYPLGSQNKNCRPARVGKLK